MSRFLVVNADDFGLTLGVSRGILDAHRRGIVTSTTALANLPPQPALDAEAARQSTLGLGLHFNLTWGTSVSPASAVPSLLDGEGRFHRDPRMVAERAAPDEVRREAEAQLEAFARRFGRSPTHLDSHHHVHRIPGVLDPLVGVVLSTGLPLRSQEPRLREGLRRQGVRTPDHFVGGDGPAPYWTLDRLLESLAALPLGVTELMCHPGYYDEALAYSRYGRQREVELAALLDAEAAATTTRLGIRLGHFGSLALASGE